MVSCTHLVDTPNQVKFKPLINPQDYKILRSLGPSPKSVPIFEKPIINRFRGMGVISEA